MPHISFSALKIFNECSHKYKLNYVDDIRQFTGNEFTAFGTALHEACERKVLDVSIDAAQAFRDKFTEELSKLPEADDSNRKLREDMQKQGETLSSLILDALKAYFGSFQVVSAEEELLLPLEGSNFEFKGYVDLIIQTSDGIYHIIDWKSCSFGWTPQKKSDSMTSYQLTLYKNFFSKIKNIDPKNIETHFALLKRTAKKNQVEIFRVTSGPKKVENALKVLNNAVYNIGKGNFPKNRLNCKYCEFYKTEHCQ